MQQILQYILTSLYETGFVFGVNAGLFALLTCNIVETILDAAYSTTEQYSNDGSYTDKNQTVK